MNLKTALRSTRGFTLIELLVVIVIIGILATGAVAVFVSAQEKARDSQRVSEFQAIGKALDQFYLEDDSFPYQDTLNGTLDKTEFWAYLDKFLSKTPLVDPQNAQGYVYVYCVAPGTNGLDGKKYALATRREADAKGAVAGSIYITGNNPELITNATSAVVTDVAACTGSTAILLN